AAYRFRAGVEQQEIAGAVGVLRLTGGQAGLPEGRGLLVAEDARDGHPRERAALAGVAVHFGRAPDLRQHGHRNPEIFTDLRIPLQRLEVHQHRAGGVGDVGDVHSWLMPVLTESAREFPQNPAVDGAEDESALFGFLAGTVDVVEDPTDL